VTATDTNHVSSSKLMSIDVIGTPPSLPNFSPYGGLFDDCTLGSTCSVGMFVGGGAGAPFVWMRLACRRACRSDPAAALPASTDARRRRALGAADGFRDLQRSGHRDRRSVRAPRTPFRCTSRRCS
jgi:hypothetical protein